MNKMTGARIRQSLRTWVAATGTACVLGLGAATFATTYADADQHEHKAMTKIILTVEGVAISATLNDSAAARDFLSLLPLTLTLDDYANTEKVSGLPRRLSTNDAPEGFDPAVGDLTYYAPWGNLALFYRDFGYARGLVSLGRIDSDITPFVRSGSFVVTFEIAK